MDALSVTGNVSAVYASPFVCLTAYRYKGKFMVQPKNLALVLSHIIGFLLIMDYENMDMVVWGFFPLFYFISVVVKFCKMMSVVRKGSRYGKGTCMATGMTMFMK